MPRSNVDRILPDVLGTVVATGIGMIPVHRLPRPVRIGYVVLPAMLTAGAVLVGTQRGTDRGADEERPGASAPTGTSALRMPTASETVLPLVLGGVVAGAGAAGIRIDQGVETLLRRRGVPAPRVWMGVASGALSQALVTLGERASDRVEHEALEDGVLELLTDADPLSLAPGRSVGTPADEYQPEAQSVMSILQVHGEITPAELDQVWEKWFDRPLTPLLGEDRAEELAAALSALTSPPSAR